MKLNNKQIEKWRVKTGIFKSGESMGNNGAFFIKSLKIKSCLYAVVSDGGGWDHVSVSVNGINRCPTWDEMCFVKDLFFEPEETVVQFHPSKDAYVNNHKYCLHLWRKQGSNFELPPTEMVGIRIEKDNE